jgi:hypothetical protein
VHVQVTTRLCRRRIFSYESLNARKEEKLSTDELPTRKVQDSPLSFFCPTSCSIQESEGFFCRQATYKGKYGKAKEAVKSARAGLLPQKGDVRNQEKKRKEKKKTKVGKKVAPAKARFPVP